MRDVFSPTVENHLNRALIKGTLLLSLARCILEGECLISRVGERVTRLIIDPMKTWYPSSLHSFFQRYRACRPKVAHGLSKVA